MDYLNHLNIAHGGQLQPVDIGHQDYLGLVSADTAFWALVQKKQFGRALSSSSPLLRKYQRKAAAFAEEMERLRFGLRPSAVYLNPTDRCNLNCAYCYIPEDLRKNGRHMSGSNLRKALRILKDYFNSNLPQGQLPQVVFHGAEPLLNKEAVFAAIDEFSRDFRFGIQTNGTLLDAADITFLTARKISIGLSLDGHIPRTADCLRRGWNGEGVSQKVIAAIEQLRGCANYSVICTVTKENMSAQVRMVEFLHRLGVPTCMLNPVRCTLPGSRGHRPADLDIAKDYLRALERTEELYQESGRKLIVANFANVLIAIIAPTSRRLMCDISPCGGGRCFFAVAANGGIFPCSEFIGLPEFKGGNIFRDDLCGVLKTAPFTSVKERRIEHIAPCNRCAIRHFCGAPCPAEAYAMNGEIETPGAFCELYAEQARYAFRLIADNKMDAYLWDDWDKGTLTTFKM